MSSRPLRCASCQEGNDRKVEEKASLASRLGRKESSTSTLGADTWHVGGGTGNPFCRGPRPGAAGGSSGGARPGPSDPSGAHAGLPPLRGGPGLGRDRGPRLLSPGAPGGGRGAGRRLFRPRRGRTGGSLQPAVRALPPGP